VGPTGPPGDASRRADVRDWHGNAIAEPPLQSDLDTCFDRGGFKQALT